MKSKFHRHYHLGVQGTPSITCYVVETEETDTDPQISYMSFSICNPSDNFSRELGRTISSNRYDSGKYISVDRWTGSFLIDDILAGLEHHLDSNDEDEFHRRVYEVLVQYHYNPDYIMTDGMQVNKEKSGDIYFDKILPFLFKFRIFQWWFYGT